MNTGAMRFNLTVNMPPTTRPRNSFGQETAGTPTTFTAWANVTPLEGREAVVARQLRADATDKVVMRYNSQTSTITTAATITFKGRTLAVLSIKNVEERNRELEILTKEVKAVG
jgi:SPP1 family predicted phage head-tail adaptor